MIALWRELILFYQRTEFSLWMIWSGRPALTVDTEMLIEWTSFLCVRLSFFLDWETRFQNEEETKSGQISSDYTYTIFNLI